MKLERLLVTTDFSPPARRAYALAAALARHHRCSIELVHAAEALPPWLYASFDEAGTELPTEDWHEAIESQLATEAGDPAFGGAEVEARLVQGPSLAAAVGERARESRADLVLAATHGHSGLGRHLLGSFAQRLVRLSPVPVLTARSEPPGEGAEIELRLEKVLVPFDLSRSSRAVLPLARFLASTHGSRLTFFHVIESVPPVVHLAPGAVLFDAISDATPRAARRAEREFASLSERELSGLDARLETAEGVPFLRILERAEEGEVDAIAMATHGWTGLRHLLLGSVAEKIVRKAPCHVFTARPAQESGAEGVEDLA